MSFSVSGRRGIVLSSGVFETLNTEESMFDAVHYAMTSKKYNDTTKSINGDSVGFMTEKIAGTYPLKYGGLATPAISPAELGVPTITGVPPQLIDDKWLMFDNRPQTNYNSDSFTTIPPPFEVNIVSRIMPGQEFEAKMENGPNAAYLGDSGNVIRIYNSLGALSGVFKPPYYEITLERVVVKVGSVDYWLNGELAGSFDYSGRPSDEIIATVYKSIYQLGAFTNVMDFDFGALYFKGSIFSDSDYGTIYTSIASKWGVGNYPNEILLNNIHWTRTGTSGAYTYTANADVQSTPSGVTAADPDTWDYQWFWKDDETNYATQTMFSTSRVVHTGDFPANDGSHINVAIKFRVKPKGTDGSFWRYISGTFDLY